MASTGPGADIPTVGSIFSCPGPSPLPHRYEVSAGHFGDNIPCDSGGGGGWICASSSLPPPPRPGCTKVSAKVWSLGASQANTAHITIITLIERY